ncbi:hypothetical protein [Janthinobacterium sp. GW458P]|nr:hypothetical protein [Janthinobacterium sp. GW458P]
MEHIVKDCGEIVFRARLPLRGTKKNQAAAWFLLAGRERPCR